MLFTVDQAKFNVCVMTGNNGAPQHFLYDPGILKLPFSIVSTHTVCFLNSWPQTKCRVTFDTSF